MQKPGVVAVALALLSACADPPEEPLRSARQALLSGPETYVATGAYSISTAYSSSSNAYLATVLYAGQCLGYRLDAQGQRVGNQILLSTSPYDDNAPGEPQVIPLSSGGNAFLVVARHYDNSELADGGLFFTQVTSSFQAVDAGMMPYYGDGRVRHALGGGSQTLTVWENSPQQQVVGRFTNGGAQLGSTFPIFTSDGGHWFDGARVTFGSGGYLVVARNSFNNGNTSRISGRFVSGGTGLPTGSELALSGDATTLDFAEVAHVYPVYLAAWMQLKPDGGYDLNARRFDATGTPLDAVPVVITSGFPQAPSVRPRDFYTGFIITWIAQAGATNELFGAIATSNGTKLEVTQLGALTTPPGLDGGQLPHVYAHDEAAGPTGDLMLTYLRGGGELALHSKKLRFIPDAGAACSGHGDCLSGACVNNQCCATIACLNVDAGTDAGSDAGLDAGTDAGVVDAGVQTDAGVLDAGQGTDSGTPVDAGGGTDAGSSDGGGIAPPIDGGTQGSHYRMLGCTQAGGGLWPLGGLLVLALLRRRTRKAAVAVVTLVFAVNASAADSGRLSLAFVGVRASSGIAPPQVVSLSEYTQTQLEALNLYDVRGPSELEAVIGLERQRQLMGCSDSSSACMAELAGALNVARLLTGDVSKVGDSVLLNLSLVDARTGRAVGRVGRRVRNLDALLDVIPEALHEVTRKDAAVRGVAPTVTASSGEPAEPAPSGPFAPFVVGLRTDVDVAGVGATVGPTVQADAEWIGGTVTVLLTSPIGVRGEVRVHPWTFGILRPWASAGATLFAPAVGIRGAVGLEVALLRRLRLNADLALEGFANNPAGYAPLAVMLGVSAGFAF